MINFWAILAAVAANMAIGSLWYSPLLFGKTWLKHMKIKPADIKKMRKKGNKAMLLAIIPSFILAYVLAQFIDYMNAETIPMSATLAFWLWIGFVFTTNSNSVLFEQKTKTVFIIGMGYHLFSMLVMAAILAVWR